MESLTTISFASQTNKSAYIDTVQDAERHARTSSFNYEFHVKTLSFLTFLSENRKYKETLTIS
jgi:hypothetical protein